MNLDKDGIIYGMKFHVSGKELKDSMLARADWHQGRIVELTKQRAVAVDALETAAKAAESAGPPRSGRGKIAAPAAARLSLGGGAPQRNYGEEMEDPVSAIDQALDFHTNQAVALTFYATHVLVDQTYVLNHHEISQYELIVVLG